MNTGKVVAYYWKNNEKILVPIYLLMLGESACNLMSSDIMLGLNCPSDSGCSFYAKGH
jgi:hypothetical protein